MACDRDLNLRHGRKASPLGTGVSYMNCTGSQEHRRISSATRTPYSVVKEQARRPLRLPWIWETGDAGAARQRRPASLVASKFSFGLPAQSNTRIEEKQLVRGTEIVQVVLELYFDLYVVVTAGLCFLLLGAATRWAAMRKHEGVGTLGKSTGVLRCAGESTYCQMKAWRTPFASV